MEKRDRTFLAALAVFAVLCVGRFFEHTLNFHSAPMGILQQYRFAELATAVYFAVLFLLYGIMLRKMEAKEKTIAYFMMAFLSVFAFPMYLPANYFGAVDIYAWIALFVAAGCLIFEKGEWLLVPLSLAAAAVSPMSLFGSQCMLVLLLFYRYWSTERKKYLWLGILSMLASFVGVGLTVALRFFSTDAQQVLSTRKFLVLAVMMCPYLLMVGTLFRGIFSDASRRMKKCYGLLLAGWIPAAAVYLIAADYSRVFYQVFFYFIFLILMMLTFGDTAVSSAMEKLKEKVLSWVPIPAVLIAYPFLFLTFWISGPVPLLVEKILGH